MVANHLKYNHWEFSCLAWLLTGVWLAVNISSLRSSVVRALAWWATGFESQLRLDFHNPLHTVNSELNRYLRFQAQSILQQGLYIHQSSSQVHRTHPQIKPHLKFYEYFSHISLILGTKTSAFESSYIESTDTWLIFLFRVNTPYRNKFCSLPLEYKGKLKIHIKKIHVLKNIQVNTAFYYRENL